MSEDPRCCGSGTCIIDLEGRCWCGQQWDGQQMCTPVPPVPPQTAQPNEATGTPFSSSGGLGTA